MRQRAIRLNRSNMALGARNRARAYHDPYAPYTAVAFNRTLTTNFNGGSPLVPWLIGTGPFTVDLWVYQSNAIGYRGIFSIPRVSLANFICRTFGGELYVGNTPTNVGAFPASTWLHLAFCRKDGVLSTYVDGILKASFADTYNYDGNQLVIGADWNATGYFVGYINYVRLTMACRWSSNFIPPNRINNNG